MTQDFFVELLKSGAKQWNEWRKNHPHQSPVLRNIDFTSEFPDETELYHLPHFDDVDFSHVDLHMSSLRNGYYYGCCFDGAKISFADLVDAYFSNCTFRNVNMRVSKVGSATFNNCTFENADLSYCSAEDTSFKGSQFINAKLEHVSFIANDFSNTKLTGCFVYGISSWDLNLENSNQEDLIITKEDQPIITVDNIELAQFIYLMINNANLRNIIDTITSKVVLILGNFSEVRKAVLDEIRSKLRHYNYIPVMFDFEKPASRNFTETVYTLAHMSRFVIADLSSVRSIGHELAIIVPKLPSVTFYPIILKGEKEYGMFNDLLIYHWVRPIKEYLPNGIKEVLEAIIDDQAKQKEELLD
ncbi:pentapeptide repeat-containing protein [Desulfitobacterium hafniense]|uniref:Pentapeptide repeat protein n=5 Tax=root TaxID=1 RepID=Q24N08_DESHY|nr:pentapeptide repeat-containing protein [Desulfitobacterium hafniense]ACL22653.1 pentapeptide repeat protein [Desulfitobacterium hafniense DCB-2]KTE93671.1 hypothetical protein AT727_01580 [Desulfitobacterium hafniense]MEA5022107.1 pentapeptide repeat-containing protein [Desulfitobacterium hafniense]BAE86584.1 hypothetical protein DSY4795 [Desulfitobacterium hafniense Y51]